MTSTQNREKDGGVQRLQGFSWQCETNQSARITTHCDVTVFIKKVRIVLPVEIPWGKVLFVKKNSCGGAASHRATDYKCLESMYPHHFGCQSKCWGGSN
jgi:hypothetical protein